MFSKESSKLLEQSTTEFSYGSISNAGTSTEKWKSKSENPELTSSSSDPEYSKHASSSSLPHNRRTLDDSSSPPIHTSSALVASTWPEYSFSVPIIFDEQTRDSEDEQQIADDVPLSTCSILVNFYKNTAIKLRNSFFIHIFQVLFSLISLSAIVMGVLFDRKCMEYELLPAFGGVTGFIGLVFTGIWMSLSCHHRLDESTTIEHIMLFFSFFGVFWISVIVVMSVFGVLAYNYDEETTDCSKTFYYYAFYKQIATGASGLVAALLYLPGDPRNPL